ncbi:transcriptional regulator family: Fungal Specific TF [Penicillium roqueforti]|nr:transcriptional regulator family: Fungal Specific TF [Penicillium roqueforti]KAI2748602.1 transcriptional regulator family: Fungal Specific TF [Penicillium roqueforti]KAI2753768.1 transcriptional regulator family: Fungal Specific TF [Penicillium roqueforti]KAI3154375.1 transcriptional regulator family: Fungal Specific TF [Penicillium roqueforti]KAI3156146.1 transcriptional regulator family: Fungal Specific TF [Penicillium roqueforti]
MNQSPPNAQPVSGPSIPGNSSAPSSLRGPLAGGRQITRNRASYSCHTCRRRKVKCDKIHPICGNCVKNNTECIYDVSSQKDDDRRDGSPQNIHGIKRRREMPRTLEEDVDELQSLYGHLKRAESTGEKPDPSAIESRLDKLMSMIERLGRNGQTLEDVEIQATAVEPTQLDDSRPSNSLDGNKTPPRSTSPRRIAAESSSDEFPIPSGQATDLVDPVGSLNLGHLSLEDGGRSRYVGTTYWAYISGEINELNQLLRDQNSSHDQSTPEKNNQDITDSHADGQQSWRESIGSSAPSMAPRSRSFQQSIIFPSGDSPSINERVVEPEMLDHMPTRRQSHILYKGFISGVHAISPIIHPPTILKLYNSFWDWYDYSSYSGESCPNPSFIPLLYAIWYGGSVTISIRAIEAEFNVSSRSALSTIYTEEVTKWLTKIKFPRSPSLQGLAAYLLVQTIVTKEEEPLTTSLFVSLAMRVAQTMGLHRDPAKFGIEPCEAEYRRRLWWHIIHMDCVVAMSSGLPPLVNDENYWDVCETSEMKDTMLGSPAAESYMKQVASRERLPDNPDDPTICGGPSMVNVYYLTARGKYTMARAIRRILKIQLGIKPLTRQDMEELRSILLDLQLRLNSIINRIPEGKDVDNLSTPGRAFSISKSPDGPSSDTELPGEGPTGCSEQYHSPVLICFHKWAKIILSLYIDKAFCVAYQPFLKNARSRIWPAARQSALRHCHGFMEKFIQLATDPDFQPFHWSWPGNHQPMHATMIMLIDLYERPYSPEAPKSRAFIDSILALSGPDGGVVGGEDGVSTQRPLKDGGREAWDMIRRLRQKAWQKAGLNPRMLWTEQDQIQAGVASPVDTRGDCHSPSSDHSQAESPGSASAGHPSTHKSKPSDFVKTFYNLTRSHTSDPVNPDATKTLLRYQYEPQGKALSPISQSQFNPPPADNPIPPRIGTSSPNTDSLFGAPPPTQCSASTPPAPHIQPSDADITAGGGMSFVDPACPNGIPRIPTPPSMVDPNLNFDWDQWDAVFGQHLPVADDLMELDPVSGLDLTTSTFHGTSPINMPDLDANGLPLPGCPPEGGFPPWNGKNEGGWPGYP